MNLPEPRAFVNNVTGVAVSIILPTFNRAAFLPEAIRAIRGQEFTDWELIVVDDGSTDETAELLPRLVQGMTQPFRYIRQDNQGAAVARNVGLRQAGGRYIAFYDSDDLWESLHLRLCVQVLDSHPEIGWVYGASRIVDHVTGRVLCNNCLHDPSGGPAKFIRTAEPLSEPFALLRQREAITAALAGGLLAGLQVSVIRIEVLAEQPVPPFRIGEDQVLAARCLLENVRFAVSDQVHLIYHVHDTNESSAGAGSRQKKAAVYRDMIEALSSLEPFVRHDRQFSRILNRRIAEDEFWNVGYRLQLDGDLATARHHYVRALRRSPFTFRFWKTLVGLLVRSLFGTRSSHPHSAAPISESSDGECV